VVTVALSLLLGPAAVAQAAHDRPAAPKAPGSSTAGTAQGRMQASAPPVFNNFLFCISNAAYVDFTDPDGDDLRLNVFVWIYFKDGREPRGAWLLNSGGAGHGVFFFLDLDAMGINRESEVSNFDFVPLDETSTWGERVWADASGSCRRL
jgi:hypothetical protein